MNIYKINYKKLGVVVVFLPITAFAQSSFDNSIIGQQTEAMQRAWRNKGNQQKIYQPLPPLVFTELDYQDGSVWGVPIGTAGQKLIDANPGARFYIDRSVPPPWVLQVVPNSVPRPTAPKIKPSVNNPPVVDNKELPPLRPKLGKPNNVPPEDVAPAFSVNDTNVIGKKINLTEDGYSVDIVFILPDKTVREIKGIEVSDEAIAKAQEDAATKKKRALTDREKKEIVAELMNAALHQAIDENLNPNIEEPSTDDLAPPFASSRPPKSATVRANEPAEVPNPEEVRAMQAEFERLKKQNDSNNEANKRRGGKLIP